MAEAVSSNRLYFRTVNDWFRQLRTEAATARGMAIQSPLSAILQNCIQMCTIYYSAVLQTGKSNPV